MMRTSKMVLAVELALPVLCFGSVGNAAAFCIHNWTDTEVKRTSSWRDLHPV